jgi:hypothetical protein
LEWQSFNSSFFVVAVQHLLHAVDQRPLLLLEVVVRFPQAVDFALEPIGFPRQDARRFLVILGITISRLLVSLDRQLDLLGRLREALQVRKHLPRHRQGLVLHVLERALVRRIRHRRIDEGVRLALRAGVVRLADVRPHAGGHQTAGLAKGDIAGLYMRLYFQFHVIP